MQLGKHILALEALRRTSKFLNQSLKEQAMNLFN